MTDLEILELAANLVDQTLQSYDADISDEDLVADLNDAAKIYESANTIIKTMIGNTENKVVH